MGKSGEKWGKVAKRLKKWRKVRKSGEKWWKVAKSGKKWFDSRAFFAERETTGQSLWMDLALARRSGQELRKSNTGPRPGGY